MTKKSHNHRLQTNPWHYEEETQNTGSHNTNKVKQPALFLSKNIAKLEKTLRTISQNKNSTQNESINIQ